jgi:pyruvate/2-oxoacid:ferredoxin oxidoreductase alpha subunit
MKQGNKYTLLSGNHAVSWAARLARPKVIPVYPITPQTPILEKISDFQAAGDLDADILTPESEHSAMAACITASLTGVRVFTATASQGLMLMHELLHYAAGARAPIVMFNVNRTIGSPWGFWPDQTDSLAQRDTGWIQFYTESAQESLDTVIHAFRIAEQVKLPAMINHEAFYVSHAMEPVNVPAQESVDEFLPPLVQEHMLDPEIGESFGYVCDHATMRQSRVDLSDAMEQVIGAAAEANSEWQRLTGREYDIIEPYRCDNAELVIVAMGSMCGTIYDAVDALRDAGKQVGLLKIRLFRPFPVAAVRNALAGIPVILVLDRNFSPGIGGVLHQEIRSALYGIEHAPKLHGYLAGVGGINVSPGKIEEFVNAAISNTPVDNSVWVE